MRASTKRDLLTLAMLVYGFGWPVWGLGLAYLVARILRAVH